jgi:hypothetical protein
MSLTSPRLRLGVPTQGLPGRFCPTAAAACAQAAAPDDTPWLPVPARARNLTQLVVNELVTNALEHAPGPVHR